VLVALNTVQLARRDFLFSDHDQVQSTPEDLCTIRAQNCALFLLTYTAPGFIETVRVCQTGATPTVSILGNGLAYDALTPYDSGGCAHG